MSPISAAGFVVPLKREHQRGTFDCGDDALNRYIKRQARQDGDKRVAAPFVILQASTDVVLGFYTLSSSLVPVHDLPGDLTKKLPRYAQLPVTLLGRLACDKTAKRMGLGKLLLVDALARSLRGSKQIASMAVVVDAKDAAAEAFYKHFGFLPLQVTPRRLFLPMTQIARLFS